MELSYSLTLADVLHHIHIANGLWLVPVEGDGSLLHAIISSPIGILVVIGQVLGCIVAVGTSLSGVAYSNLCLLCQILAQTGTNHVAHILEDANVDLWQQTTLVRRAVENQGSISTYSLQIHLEEALNREWLLTLVPEPSLVGELGIALSRVPLPAVLCTIHSVAFWCIASFVGEPVGFASPSCLVADPSCLSTHTPEDDVWTNLVDRVSEVRNIIIGRTIYVHGRIASAVVSVTTVGTVKPHFKLVFAILCQLRALAQENIVYIFLCTVVLAVSIPWRNIEAVLHT